MAPVILEVALNGATPRDRNPHVPRTVDEIVEQGLAALGAGAAIVHHHHDAPMFTVDGVHPVDPYLEVFGALLARHPEALLYPTMAAGARDIPIERRWAHVEELARRGLGGMTLVDPGSVNLGLTADGALDPAGAARPYQNSLDDTEYMVRRTAELGAAPSVSIFEPGFLRVALTLHRHGRLPAGAMIKLYLADDLQFGLPPTPASLEAYLQLLEPSGLPWSVAVLGGDVVGSGIAEYALRRGGHLRVGLEDVGGRPGHTPSNAELLDDALRLLDRLGLTPATPGEARDLLGVPAEV